MKVCRLGPKTRALAGFLPTSIPWTRTDEGALPPAFGNQFESRQTASASDAAREMICFARNALRKRAFLPFQSAKSDEANSSAVDAINDVFRKGTEPTQFADVNNGPKTGQFYLLDQGEEAAPKKKQEEADD